MTEPHSNPTHAVTRPEHPTLGIVVPCYNEAAVLSSLIEELLRFAESADLPVRFLFIDDGSEDETYCLLAEACKQHENMACIRFSRNFGHQTAISAGLRYIEGDVVAVIDADLQDPPRFLLDMLEKWREGYDVIYGVRQNRKEGVFLRASYSAFYRLLKEIANVDIPVDAGDFSLMDRRVVEAVNRMPERNRFVRGLRGWVGFKQIGLPYDRESRAAGAPKYDLNRLTKLAVDGLISFSAMPLRLAVWLGVLASVLGFGLLVWAAAQAVFFTEKPPWGWASLAVMILFFAGIQLIVLGIIGEYVGRIFEEVKRRPHFIIDDYSGWVSKHDPGGNVDLHQG